MKIAFGILLFLHAIMALGTTNVDVKPECQLMFQQIETHNKPRKSCAAAEVSSSFCTKIMSTAQWTVEESTRFVQQCPVRKTSVEVVSRHEVSLEECRKRPEDRKVKVPPGTWAACPSKEPVCDNKNFPGWQEQIGAVASLHREIHKAQCVKPYHAPEKVEQLRSQFSSMTIPKCTPPLTDKPTAVVIHHTAFPQEAGPDVIQYAHMYDIQSWSDCGYHYIVSKDRDGHWRVQECRATYTVKNSVTGKPEKKLLTGAHMGPGLNSGSIGIVIAGNYEGAGGGDIGRAAPGFISSDPQANGIPSPPPPEAVEVLNRFVHELKEKYPSISDVKTHQKAKADFIGCGNDCGPCKTVCPGIACAHLPALIGRSFAK